MTDSDPDLTPEGPARLPPVFWILIVFGVICVFGGYVVARHGPRLFAAPEGTAQGARLASEPGAGK